MADASDKDDQAGAGAHTGPDPATATVGNAKTVTTVAHKIMKLIPPGAMGGPLARSLSKTDWNYGDSETSDEGFLRGVVGGLAVLQRVAKDGGGGDAAFASSFNTPFFSSGEIVGNSVALMKAAQLYAQKQGLSNISSIFDRAIKIAAENPDGLKLIEQVTASKINMAASDLPPDGSVQSARNFTSAKTRYGDAGGSSAPSAGSAAAVLGAAALPRTAFVNGKTVIIPSNSQYAPSSISGGGVSARLDLRSGGPTSDNAPPLGVSTKVRASSPRGPASSTSDEIVQAESVETESGATVSTAPSVSPAVGNRKNNSSESSPSSSTGSSVRPSTTDISSAPGHTTVLPPIRRRARVTTEESTSARVERTAAQGEDNQDDEDEEEEFADTGVKWPKTLDVGPKPLFAKEKNLDEVLKPHPASSPAPVTPGQPSTAQGKIASAQPQTKSQDFARGAFGPIDRRDIPQVTNKTKEIKDNVSKALAKPKSKPADVKSPQGRAQIAAELKDRLQNMQSVKEGVSDLVGQTKQIAGQMAADQAFKALFDATIPSFGLSIIIGWNVLLIFAKAFNVELKTWQKWTIIAMDVLLFFIILALIVIIVLLVRQSMCGGVTGVLIQGAALVSDTAGTVTAFCDATDFF